MSGVMPYTVVRLIRPGAPDRVVAAPRLGRCVVEATTYGFDRYYYYRDPPDADGVWTAQYSHASRQWAPDGIRIA